MEQAFPFFPCRAYLLIPIPEDMATGRLRSLQPLRIPRHAEKAEVDAAIDIIKHSYSRCNFVGTIWQFGTRGDSANK